MQEDIMTISYIVLFAKDMKKTLEVYCDAIGLEMNQRYTSDKGEDVAFLVEKGGTPMVDQPLLEIVVHPAKAKNLSSVFLGFEVDSLEETTKKMKEAGMKVINEPYSPAPNVSIITMTGPDGETIELMQNP
jgi:catechol 2,3-dioxygenase-like lactoylglutathione lyase family enzyme